MLKDDAIKVLHSICQQIWRTQKWPQDWKRSVFIPIPKKGNAKEYSNYCITAFISHASKVMLKILQARLQQYMNREVPDVQAGFRKGRGIRDQIAKISWVIQKAREFQKISTSASLAVTNKKDHKRLISVTNWITKKKQVKFLEIHNLPKLNHEERENLNITITSKETESLIKTSQ